MMTAVRGWVVVFFALLSLASCAKESYGVVVDLGSKGSRVGVFVWPSDARLPYTEVAFGGGKNPWYMKITPGVATYADNPSSVGPYLNPLLDYAASNVPSAQQTSTPIFIKGTDNLRRLAPGVADAILDHIYDYTSKNYKFLMTPNSVGLISGLLEGGLMWVSANQLFENFADGNAPTGILDMGSGSTQIAFIPKSGTFLPPDYSFEFAYKTTTYTPYVYSYSGYGYLSALFSLNATLSAETPHNVVRNPCLLNGYESSLVIGNKEVVILGTGSWSQCSELTYAYLNTTAQCSYPPCAFDSAFQPLLNGDFLAVSNFADVVDILGLGSMATVQQITNGGVRFCSLSWSEAQAQYPDTSTDDLYTFCFGANYVSTLLGKGFKFPSTTRINFGKKYNKAPYSWILGEMIYELQNGW